MVTSPSIEFSDNFTNVKFPKGFCLLCAFIHRHEIQSRPNGAKDIVHNINLFTSISEYLMTAALDVVKECLLIYSEEALKFQIDIIIFGTKKG